jgi:hypothetical protein
VLTRDFIGYYWCVALWHFIVYRFYAGKDSDFKWI